MQSDDEKTGIDFIVVFYKEFHTYKNRNELLGKTDPTFVMNNFNRLLQCYDVYESIISSTTGLRRLNFCRNCLG